MSIRIRKIGTLLDHRVEMERHEEQGFMLVGLIVAIFFVLLALSVAAPKVAQGLRRDREVEAVHRGNQYVRAIRLYYRKFGHYPGSMEQLEKTNNIRFLRQQYEDPMTGKPDWKLIHVGEAKTTVKGFLAQPLAGGWHRGWGVRNAGMASTGMGSGLVRLGLRREVVRRGALQGSLGMGGGWGWYWFGFRRLVGVLRGLRFLQGRLHLGGWFGWGWGWWWRWRGFGGW